MSGRTWLFKPLHASTQTYRKDGPVIELAVTASERSEDVRSLRNRQCRVEVTHPEARELVESFARWCSVPGMTAGRALDRHQRATAAATWLRELADEIESRP